MQIKLILILAGMLTSKIVAYGTQKTHTHTLKSQRTQNKSLFGAAFGEAVTVNSNRYRAMLNEFLFTEIEEEDIGKIWFQQDFAACYIAKAILNPSG